jgi:hypothetical protein
MFFLNFGVAVLLPTAKPNFCNYLSGAMFLIVAFLCLKLTEIPQTGFK